MQLDVESFASIVAAAIRSANDPLKEHIKLLNERIAMLENRLATFKGEKGDPGEKGEKGERGEKGEPGSEGARGSDGAPGVMGARGEQGERGERGERGSDGAPGTPGAPGERGERGEKGADGIDGLGFEDMTERCEGNEIIRTYSRGDLVKEFRYRVPGIIYREVWRDGTYQAGDAVTRGGSLWIAMRETTTTPGAPNSDWRLAVKKGDIGKPGAKGEKGETGPRGERGERGPDRF
jgi:hypothetical protein